MTCISSVHRGKLGLLDLPNELLRIVFTDVAEMEPPIYSQDVEFSPTRKNDRNEALGVLRLSEVCRHFHALLISMPTLWGNVVFDLPFAPGQLALARSQSAPLRLHLHNAHVRHRYRGPDDPNRPHLLRNHLLAMACKHAARLSSITVEDLSATENKQLLSAPLPLLKGLYMFFHEEMDDFEDVCVDAPILERATFALEHYTDHVKFGQLPMFKFPAIQLLRILMVVHAPHTVLAPRWIAGILENAPLLRELSLTLRTYTLPIDWDALFNKQISPLKQLQSLRLCGTTTANLPGLFTCIGSPRPSRFFLADVRPPRGGDPDEAAAIKSFSCAFAPLLRHSSHNGFMLQTIDDHTLPALTVSAFPELADSLQCQIKFEHNADDVLNNPVVLCMRSSLGSDHPAVLKVARVFSETVAHNSIKQLVLDTSHLNPWFCVPRYVVMACPTVTQLIVNQLSWHNSNAWLPSPPAKLVLPALNSLVVTQIKMPRHFIEKSGEHIAALEGCWRRCVEWLTERAEFNMRVRHLRILGNRFLLREDMEQGLDRAAPLFSPAGSLVDAIVDERTETVHYEPRVSVDEYFSSSSSSDGSDYGTDTSDD